MLRENAEKYITFSVLTKKEIKTLDKKWKRNQEDHNLQKNFFDSSRFMLDSLSDLVDNLADGLHKDKLKGYKCSLEYVFKL